MLNHLNAASESGNSGIVHAKLVETDSHADSWVGCAVGKKLQNLAVSGQCLGIVLADDLNTSHSEKSGDAARILSQDLLEVAMGIIQ